jgi:glycosyltransferase involved in cell wall biosynthesis
MRESLSVVVPAYNEEANVESCLKKVSAVLKKLDLDSEIILVNDGSKDKTGEIAKSLIKKISNLKVIDNNPNRGYGGSLKAGFAAASKELIVFIPADNQFDFSEVTLLLDKYRETKADIISGIRTNRQDPIHRRLIGWTWNSIVRALFGYLASDIDCGFKMFRREILDHVNLTAERGAMVDTQLFASARARGFTVAEVPLTHLPRTAGNPTGVSPRVIYQSFVDLFRFWWQLKQEILVEKGKTVFRWEILLLLLILILAFVLRTYQLDKYLTFLGDEGRDASVVRDILLGRNFTIIGPGTSIGNMYLGPWYYYLMAIPLLIFNFSPVGPAMMVVIFGMLTIILVWWIGRQWFGRVPALLVSLLYATSPTVINFSRSSWNPNIMPFFALLGMYGVWKIWRFGYWRWAVISAACFAFVLNSHYLGLLLFPVAGLFLIISSRRGNNWKRYSLISVIVFLLIMSPLFVFDATHGWLNFKSMSTFFTNRQETVNLKAYKAVPNLVPLWNQIVSSLVVARQELLGQIVAIVMVVVSALVIFVDRRVRRDLIFTLVWLVTGVVGLGLYKQHIYDHYFGFIFPAVFLALGFCLAFLYRNKLGKAVVVLATLAICILNLYYTPIRYSPNDQLGRTKQISEFIIRESAGQPFNLALISKRNYDMSYRYFLDLSNSEYKTIHQQLTNQLFVICEDPPADGCEPINNPLWEVAAFGWAKVERQWQFPWGVEVYKLVHNEDGKPN